MESLKPTWYHELLALGALSFLTTLRESLLQTAARYLIALLVARHVIRAVYYLFIYPYFFSPLRHLPGPKDHHFLVGDLINQARSGNPIEPYLSWTRQWPNEPLIKFTGFGNSDCLLINDLEVFKEVFQTKSYSFIKAQFNTRIIVQVTGTGMVFAEGDLHKAQRKLLSPSFSLTKVKKAIPLFQSKAKELVQLFDKEIKSQEGTVDMSQAFSRVTVDIIAWWTLGIDLQATLTHSFFHQAYHRMFDPSLFGGILMVMNAYVPGTRSLPFEENRVFNACSGGVRSRIREVIRERFAEIDEVPGGSGGDGKGAEKTRDRPDLLTHMILESRSINEPWSEDEILENCLNMMVAGHETSATTLTWGTHIFTLYPQIQTRARAEVLRLLKKNPTPDYLDLEEGLPFIDNLTREVLRFYAPGVLAAREPVEDVTVGGTFIPKGTPLYMFPALVTRNKRIWGEDVDVFDPDRWDRLEGTPASNPLAFATFLAGPRQCIGKGFALIEIKVLFMAILSNFKFEAPVDPEDIEFVNPSPVLRPKGGLKVRVRRLEAGDVEDAFLI
ncbi:cytochrome P450 [Colletotrichum lupini]|uniref:Cytochrome P450 n=1 Tax=Colletotrichum lupini TaxID=145971 RepID=A0A9Q8SE39_9PEZI|nr:cytochrome P450 [Colletotrichum lupini]UQC75310.1 cytochrome P450 [Colletotrichum lupini]